MSPDDCAVSPITVFELYSGALLSTRSDVEQHKVDRFIAPLTIIVFDGAAAREAARLRADLKRIGSSIGPYDLLIAAEAIRSGLTLISSIQILASFAAFGRFRSKPGASRLAAARFQKEVRQSGTAQRFFHGSEQRKRREFLNSPLTPPLRNRLPSVTSVSSCSIL
jgi:predicted nucleic acid-binding protein